MYIYVFFAVKSYSNIHFLLYVHSYIHFLQFLHFSSSRFWVGRLWLSALQMFIDYACSTTECSMARSDAMATPSDSRMATTQSKELFLYYVTKFHAPGAGWKDFVDLVVLVIVIFIGSCVKQWYFLSLRIISLTL